MWCTRLCPRLPKDTTWKTRTGIRGRRTAKSSAGWGARTSTNSRYAPPTDAAAARTRGHRREKNENRLEPLQKNSPPMKTKRGDTTAPVCSTARRTTDPTALTNRNWNGLIRTRTTHRARRRGRSGRVEKTHRAHTLTLTHTRAHKRVTQSDDSITHTHTFTIDTIKYYNADPYKSGKELINGKKKPHTHAHRSTRRLDSRDGRLRTGRVTDDWRRRDESGLPVVCAQLCRSAERRNRSSDVRTGGGSAYTVSHPPAKCCHPTAVSRTRRAKDRW